MTERGETSIDTIPRDYAALFKGKRVSASLALKGLADYADQVVIVRNAEESDVLFTVRDMLAAMESTKKGYYGRIILGGAIITGVALIVLFSAN
jgi:hypothetical protein